jgi:PAS domain S-box-containing protein
MVSLINTLIAIQQHTDTAIYQENHWIREVAEKLPQMVWAADSAGRKTYCNQHYLGYTGAESTEAMNFGWQSFIHPEDIERASHSWSHSLATGLPYQVEYRLRRSDGNYRFCTVAALPFSNRTSRISGWIGISKDINEEKLAERNRELAAKLDAVSRLAANMAHQINNPLSSVTNLLYLALQDKTLAEDTRQQLEIADNELRRVAYVSRHAMRIHRQSRAASLTPICEIVERAIAIFETQLRSTAISVRRDYRTEERLFGCDDDLTAALASILENSINAIGESGQITVRITAARSWRDDSRGLRVTIADTGSGIPHVVFPKLFEPFSSSSGRPGLGLWLARQVVNSHKGRIQCRSRAGADRHGTVVSVFLPFEGCCIVNGPQLPC